MIIAWVPAYSTASVAIFSVSKVIILHRREEWAISVSGEGELQHVLARSSRLQHAHAQRELTRNADICP